MATYNYSSDGHVVISYLISSEAEWGFLVPFSTVEGAEPMFLGGEWPNFSQIYWRSFAVIRKWNKHVLSGFWSQ